MFPLVESWQKSGLTQKLFSQQHQLSDQVFNYWVVRYRKAQPAIPPIKTTVQPLLTSSTAEAEGAFIRIPAPAAPVLCAACAGSSNLKTAVELPSGVVLRFSGLVPVAYLKELLTGISV